MLCKSPNIVTTNETNFILMLYPTYLDSTLHYFIKKRCCNLVSLLLSTDKLHETSDAKSCFATMFSFTLSYITTKKSKALKPKHENRQIPNNHKGIKKVKKKKNREREREKMVQLRKFTRIDYGQSYK